MNEDLKIIRQTIGLLNSMVYCGDYHSERSKQQVEDGLDALRRLEENVISEE